VLSVQRRAQVKEGLESIHISCWVVFSGFCRLCFRLRAALLCWFSLAFTTCFGLHAIFRCVGYFIFICLKDSASLLFSAFFFSRGHALRVSICVFPEQTNNKEKASTQTHAQGNNLTAICEPIV
jgi:hypothetical protein